VSANGRRHCSASKFSLSHTVTGKQLPVTAASVWETGPHCGTGIAVSPVVAKAFVCRQFIRSNQTIYIHVVGAIAMQSFSAEFEIFILCFVEFLFLFHFCSCGISVLVEFLFLWNFCS